MTVVIFFNDTATTEIYTLSLHDALPIFDTPSVVGLIAGALTSTPGLAVAIDSTNSPLASIAYGIAYPFGVIGVILFVKLLPKIMRIDLDQEARRLEIERRGQYPELRTCVYRVTNPAVFNRSLAQIN